MLNRNAKLCSICAALLALLLIGGNAEQETPIPAEIENEQILQINKEPPHATLMPYAALAEALAANRLSSSYCKLLNGQWKFNYAPYPSLRPVDFWKMDYDVSGWKEIPVPANWQIHGYGTPYYKNAGYTFKKDWPYVNSDPPRNYTAFYERNPVGSYRYDFDVPQGWNGRKIFITFDGVDSAFFLWINGQKVGYNCNSRCPAEFDITKYVKSGKNTLAAEVYRYSAGSYMEDQDMFRLSGIFRNVYIWSAPQVHVRDFFVKTDLDDQYKDAVLDVTAQVKNYGKTASAVNELSVTLYNAEGKAVDNAASTATIPELKPEEEKEVKCSIKIENPLKWTAETPNLYTTVLKLGDELISTRTGFRKVEIKGRVFCINGVPVKLKGANRHENYPDTGHYVSAERMIEDLKLLKGCNSNHVRTSHYTDDPRWYELCDQWGIYLVAEANVECHGYANVLDKEPRFEKMIVDRNVENVVTKKNHCSIVIWSLGNECGGGINFNKANDVVKAIDASRPTHYQPFGIEEKNPADIDSEMYAWVSSVFKLGQADRKKPYYLCEYAHAMNNSMGSIGDYNDVIDAHEGIIGGAIWEWQDQALWNNRDPKNPHLVYGGGFDETPNDHYFICKGVIFADRSLTPKYPEVKRVYQWIGISPADLTAGKLKIRNKYQFINLNRFDIAWTISQDGTVIDQGKLPKIDVAPFSETELIVPFQKITPLPGAEYYLRISFTLSKDEIWAKAGTEVAAGQFLLPVWSLPAKTLASDIKKPQKAADSSPLAVQENDQQVTIAGKGFHVVFDRADGTIDELSYNGQQVFKPGGGPKLHVWRAPHANDDLWAADDWSSRGLNALKHSASKLDVKKIAPDIVQVMVNATAEEKDGAGFQQQITYTISGDGVIAVDQAVDAGGERFVVARMGVRMFPNAKLDRFSWLGRGPMENYSDRKRGADVGWYSTTVKGQLVPYVKPMECANHEDVRWAALTREEGFGLMAVAQSGPFQAAALPYADEDLDKAQYAYQLPQSKGPVFCFSAKTLGVGSASCGPIPLEQYIIYSDQTVFSYVLRPVPPGTKDLADLARRPVPPRVAPVEIKRDLQGLVTLLCATPGATIKYSINDSDLKPYTEPFQFKNGKLKVESTAEGYIPLPSGAMTIKAALDRSKWKIVSVDSFEEGVGNAEHAIDDDLSTYWLSRPKPAAPKDLEKDQDKPRDLKPHEMVIDFGEQLPVRAVVYHARQDLENGRIRDYEIYLTNDMSDWGRPAVRGRFHNHLGVQIARLATTAKARYLKIIALSEINRGELIAIADLSIVPVNASSKEK